MSIPAPTSAPNIFIKATRSFQREIRLSSHLEAHLLRSVRAFITAFPANEAGVASGSRWAQGAPILADCADLGASRAAEPQSEAVAALVKDVQVRLAAGIRPNVEVLDLVTFIIASTAIAHMPHSGYFLISMDNHVGLHLELDFADQDAVETFGTAAAALASAFECGNGLNARRALNALLSFIAIEPAD